MYVTTLPHAFAGICFWLLHFCLANPFYMFCLYDFTDSVTRFALLCGSIKWLVNLND